MKSITHVSRNVYRSGMIDDYQWLSDNGIGVVVFLTTPAYELYHDDRFESEEAMFYGIERFRVECSDFLPLSLKKVEEVLNLIQEAQKNDKKILISCLYGKDVTGFMVACYRIAWCDYDYRKAFDEMIKFGLSFSLFWWIYFLKRFQVKY